MTLALDLPTTPAERAALARRDRTGRRYTIDEFLALPNCEDFDLIDGELVERAMGVESEWVGGAIFGHVDQYLKHNPIGYVWGSNVNYRALPDSGHTFNRPDVSFVSAEKYPDGEFPRGYATAWPDFVVEVISPHETIYETDCKIEEFLAGGTRLVLVVDPETRRSLVHRGDGTVTKLTDADSFDGEDVLPGLKIKMADVLPKKKAKK